MFSYKINTCDWWLSLTAKFLLSILTHTAAIKDLMSTHSPTLHALCTALGTKGAHILDGPWMKHGLSGHTHLQSSGDFRLWWPAGRNCEGDTEVRHWVAKHWFWDRCMKEKALLLHINLGCKVKGPVLCHFPFFMWLSFTKLLLNRWVRQANNLPFLSSPLHSLCLAQLPPACGGR